MVAVTYTLNLADNEALDIFDSVTHAGFGDGDSVPTPSNSSLDNELLRVQLESKTKDTIEKTYTFFARVPLPQMVGDTIKELGLFDALTGGNIAARILSPLPITKTSDEEILFTIVIKVETINN